MTIQSNLWAEISVDFLFTLYFEQFHTGAKQECPIFDGIVFHVSYNVIWEQKHVMPSFLNIWQLFYSNVQLRHILTWDSNLLLPPSSYLFTK